MEVANYCAAMDTLIDQDAYNVSYIQLAQLYSVNMNLVLQAKNLVFVSYILSGNSVSVYEHNTTAPS